MKVLEFAKRLGIPASKIRFYDRQGITQSSRSAENNYRQFTPLDALDIYHAQMLRSMDMSVKEAGFAGRTYSVDRFSQWLDTRIDDLEQQIRWEEIRLQRMRQLKGYVDNVVSKPMQVVRRQATVSYNVWTVGKKGSISEQEIAAAARLQEKMPFSYITLSVPMQSLMGGEEALDVHLGLGVLEENMEKCGLTDTAGMQRFPGGDCMSVYLEMEDPFSLTQTHLRPLFDAVEREGMRVASGAVGRQFLSYQKGEKYIHGFSLGVLVEKR